MRRNILIAAAVLTAAAVIILTVIGLAAENRDYEPASWYLRHTEIPLRFITTGK